MCQRRGSFRVDLDELLAGQRPFEVAVALADQPERLLANIIDACDAVASAIAGFDLDAYEESPLVRSSVEREFIIGEAMVALSRVAPEVFSSVTHARRIVDFRDQLMHEYLSVNDLLVWGIANRDAPILRDECVSLLSRPEASEGD